jgi:hypothetical protein
MPWRPAKITVKRKITWLSNHDFILDLVFSEFARFALAQESVGSSTPCTTILA